MFAAFGTWGGWPALAAIGTVGAVIVAVGLQAWVTWKERRRRPQLSLIFDEHMRMDETEPKSGATLPYLRLAVKNAEGKKTAQDVEILIADVEEFATGPISGGRIGWLANPALGWANSVDPRPRMSIPPGATRYLDVCRWVDLPPLCMVLCVVPEPASNRHILVPSGWRLRLAVTMRNGDATFWDAEVSYEEDARSGISQLVNLNAAVKQVQSVSA
jgi:hypothetical protein